ncbi:MAG TPA: replication-associated recombination protein A [bacterium]|nr:replication-associated recombination protein A [bacterium]
MKQKPDSSTLDFFLSPAGLPEAVPEDAPLAVRMRPRNLEEITGQDHLLGEGKLLKRTIQADRLTSLILYGPPGSGKTTLAEIICRVTRSSYVNLNAVTANVSDLRNVLEQAKRLKQAKGMRTILFIDEIHRFNKAQQDVLMPDVERGNVILIGATTHNPSFVVNGPLLSRATICELRPLSEDHLVNILQRAVKDPERGFGKLKIKIEKEALLHIARSAAGDARRALNALEVGVLTTPLERDEHLHFTLHVAEESCQRKIVYHDRSGDYHYDLASALIKSIRGSDPDAAIYWLAKMIHGGEDPRFIIRRLLILASEDIGNADPQALILTSAGLQTIEFVGMPEAQIILSQLVIYLSLAPKSNASYLAISKALETIRDEKIEEVPNHLRDRSYPGAKKLGHGEGYVYPHNFPGHFKAQEYISKEYRFYFPAETGFEKILKEGLQSLRSKS